MTAAVFLFLTVLLSTIGCASMPNNVSDQDLVMPFSHVAVGGSEAQLNSINMKREAEIEPDGSKRVSFMVRYKSMWIPKMVFFVSKEGIISSKSLNFFDFSESERGLPQIRKKFGISAPLVAIPREFKGHWIPIERYFKNDSIGVFLSARPSKLDYLNVLPEDQYRVSSITFKVPESPEQRRVTETY